jgi:hypothetical protein
LVIDVSVLLKNPGAGAAVGGLRVRPFLFLLQLLLLLKFVGVARWLNQSNVEVMSDFMEDRANRADEFVPHDAWCWHRAWWSTCKNTR